VFTFRIYDFEQALIGNEVWLDPTEEEARSAVGTLVLSCIPALETVNSVWQTGCMTPSDALAVSYTIHSNFD